MKIKIFAVCLFFALNQLIIAQKNNSDTLFWYRIDLDIVRDSINFRPACKILKTNPEIYSGINSDFLKYQKNVMKTMGLAIGPFIKKADALYALNTFEYFSKSSIKIEENVNHLLYWYLVKINKTRKGNSLEFCRTPAAVGNGNLNEFNHVFNESLTFLDFVIGPFQNQPEAEDSKFLNRILEPKRKSDNRYVDYETFYWFSIRLNHDSLINNGTYLLDKVYTPVKYGTMNEYLLFKKTMMAEQQITIGPYFDYYDAIASQHFYNYGLNDLDFRPWDDGIFYYFIKLKEIKTKYTFISQPCGIIEAVDYKDMVYKSMNLKDYMIIGPFRSQTYAEISMKLNTDKKYARRFIH